jgi:hypothetical protein
VAGLTHFAVVQLTIPCSAEGSKQQDATLQLLMASGDLMHRGLSATGTLEALCQLVEQQQPEAGAALGHAHSEQLFDRVCRDHLLRVSSITPCPSWLCRTVRSASPLFWMSLTASYGAQTGC